MIQLELSNYGIHLGEVIWLLSMEVQAGSGSLHLPTLVTCITCPVESPALVHGWCRASSTLHKEGSSHLCHSVCLCP